MDLIASAYSQNPITYLQTRAHNEKVRKKKLLLCDVTDWRAEGAKVLNEVKTSFLTYKSIVVPRDDFKHVLESIKLCDIEAAKDTSCRIRSPNPIVALIINSDKRRGSKSFLMRWRWLVLNQIRTSQEKVCEEFEALSFMQQMLEKSMLISKAKCMLLRMRRERYASSLAKTADIENRIKFVQSIDTCRSKSHFKPEGCRKCPIIFVKTEAFVRATDRSNGLPIITKIDHEMNLLHSELSAQMKFNEELHDAMASLRKVMEKKLIYDMQAWYTCRMANHRSINQHESMLKSLYYYRIRKLVRMKNQLDQMSYKICTINEITEFDYSYSDLNLEAEEYRRKIALRRRYIETVYSPIFWNKLKNKYFETKQRLLKEANEAEIKRRRELREKQERKQRKMMKLDENLDMSKEAILARISAKVKLLNDKKFICPRFDCHKREFKSQQRLDIHMQQHYREDAKKIKTREMHEANRKIREQEEVIFLDRLSSLRALNCSLSEHNTALMGRSTLNFSKLTWSHNAVESMHSEIQENQNENDDELDPFYGIDHPSEISFGIMVDYSLVNEVNNVNIIEHSGDLSHSDVNINEESSINSLTSNCEVTETVEPLVVQNSGIGDESNFLSTSDTLGLDTASSIECDDNLNIHNDSFCSESLQQVVDDSTLLTENSVKSELPKGHAMLKYKFRMLKSSDDNSIESSIPDNESVKSSFDNLSVISAGGKTKKWIIPKSQYKRHERISSAQLLSLPKSIDSSTFDSFQDKFTWMKHQKHVGLIYDDVKLPLKHLELLSKHPDVDCPFRIPLVPPIVRIGTLDTCEVQIEQQGSLKKEGRVAKIHVVIYVPVHENYKDTQNISVRNSRTMLTKAKHEISKSESSLNFETAAQYMSEDLNDVTIIDNHTVWGTYLVNVNGVSKVPTITSGRTQTLCSGDLLCIGVKWRGPDTLSAVEASSAVMVYRVRCSDDVKEKN